MRRLHYAWVIVACAFVTLAISNGMLLAGLSVFDEQLLSTFGWNRATLKLRDFVTLAVAGLAGPVAGALADRYGVRPLILAGALLLTGGMFAWSRVQSVTDMVLIHVAFGFALATAGLVVNVLLVSRWFHRRRGTAIGLALVGTSLGSTVFPLVNARMLQTMAWPQVFEWLALVPLVLVPIALFLVRERPRDIGRAPLGCETSEARSSSEEDGVSFGQAIRTRAFWTLALGAMMTFYAILGAASHLFLHLRDLDFDLPAAARGVSLLFAMGLVGKATFGILADHLRPKRVFLLGLASMFVGSLCLASMNASLFWPFILAFGLGWGGLYTVLQLLTLEIFGLRAAGRILGTITVLDAVGGGLGPWVTGALYDRFGDYAVAFGLMSAMIAVSFLAATTLDTKRPTPATAS